MSTDGERVPLVAFVVFAVLAGGIDHELSDRMASVGDIAGKGVLLIRAGGRWVVECSTSE